MSIPTLEKIPIQERCFLFAERVVKLAQHLSQTKKENVMSKQVLRCGTAIGANVEDATGSSTGTDYCARISIAYKEARKTSYWLRLLRAGEFLTECQFKSIYADVETLCRILWTIRKHSQAQLRAQEQAARAHNRGDSSQIEFVDPVTAANNANSPARAFAPPGAHEDEDTDTDSTPPSAKK
ncbi:MAG: four helix bundle protein [Puniceicoccales bacterium]|jgi:four helix bundle protein|nr:four helix bundle protein [Puniceicoccales bacterium]